MLNSFVLALTQTQGIVLIVVGALFLLMFTYNLIRMIINKKKRAEEALREVDGTITKRGVRYTEDMTVVDTEGNMNISYGKRDVVLKQNQTYIAEKHGYVKPGKYCVLATHNQEDKFNIRIGAYVKEYYHNQEIILAEGEEITAVSTNVILR